MAAQDPSELSTVVVFAGILLALGAQWRSWKEMIMGMRMRRRTRQLAFATVADRLQRRPPSTTVTRTDSGRVGTGPDGG